MLKPTITLPRNPPALSSPEKSAQAVIFLAAALIVLSLMIGALRPDQSNAAERDVTLNLKAGETYVLKGLDKDGVPEVRFIDNPHAFSLQCAEPGQCFVIAAEAGHGNVRVALEGGDNATYDITVSALTNPAKPLEPGLAPAALGNTTADNTGTGALGAQAAPLATNAAATAPAPSPSPAVESSDGSGSELPPSPPVMKYSQNPLAKQLELPPAATGADKHFLPERTVKLAAGSSRLFDFAVPMRRVSVADTDVADIEVMGPTQLMVVGHKPGATTLAIWDQSGRSVERQIRVLGDGPQQVELRVLVAEINRTKLETQGMDISVALKNAGIAVVGLQGLVATPYSPNTNLTASGGAGTIAALPPSGVFPPGGTLIPLLMSSNISYGLTEQNGQVTTNAFFQFLEQHDLAKILAQPRLIASSGDQAKFLSGGEIPIVIAQALNTSIVFKQFGTSVNFRPTVIDEDEIDLTVNPEFSQPDYSQGVQLFGFNIPAFITRRAETRVRMKENQTLIIAGLILDNVQTDLRKTPYLGDVPYLGYLFKHTYYRKLKTELVMTVTPEIIRPIPAGSRLALPTDRGPMTPGEVRTRSLREPDAVRARFP